MGPCAVSALGIPPFGPPEHLSHALSALVADKTVVNLRSGAHDLDTCLASTAARVVTLATPGSSEAQCAEYDAQIRSSLERHHGIKSYNHSSLWCSAPSAATVRGKGGIVTFGQRIIDEGVPVPDADFFLWWQRRPHWLSGQLLDALKQNVREGKLRSTSRALVLFDMTQWVDAIDWEVSLEPNATWWRSSEFDERGRCNETIEERLAPQLNGTPISPVLLQKHRSICATRACGRWVAATFSLAADEPGSQQQHADIAPVRGRAAGRPLGNQSAAMCEK